MTPQQLSALGLLAFWWRCVEAGRGVDGEPLLADDTPVLHYVDHGTTAIVTAGHLRDLVVLAATAKREQTPGEPGLTRLLVTTTHPGDFVLHNERDGTRWRGTPEGLWKRAE